MTRVNTLWPLDDTKRRSLHPVCHAYAVSMTGCVVLARLGVLTVSWSSPA